MRERFEKEILMDQLLVDSFQPKDFSRYYDAWDMEVLLFKCEWIALIWKENNLDIEATKPSKWLHFSWERLSREINWYYRRCEKFREVRSSEIKSDRKATMGNTSNKTPVDIMYTYDKICWILSIKLPTKVPLGFPYIQSQEKHWFECRLFSAEAHIRKLKHN